jgi:poly-gamma-glutamate capsule biosynthesis protein CapA/YwtB (metallophosphatase superfamily)
MSYASETGDFSIALAGDCMLTRRLRVFDEPAFLELAKIFRDCDAGMGNLESVVRHWDEGTPGITTGTFMTTAPELLEEFKWFGITMLGCANNHAFDYGEGGVLATIRHLDAAGIAHAGSGRNLAEARMPGYLDTRGGRVAILATTATFRPWNRAGSQRPDIRGRPGINPLGFKNTYTVDGSAFEQLDRISRELGFAQKRARQRQHFFSETEAPPDREEELSLLNERFVRGDGFKVASECDQTDLEDNLRWIKEARRQSDWVVVNFHSHEYGQSSLLAAKTQSELSEPPDFARAFARAAIDAGADIVVGHGSHTPLGIDFHKGKPIFYSVGNLIFQNETVPFFPSVAYERFGLGPDATPADFLDARTGNGKKGHVAHQAYWENIAATCHYQGGKLSEVRIHPVDQGFGRPRGQRGRPVLASGETAAAIIARVDTLSRPYGVTVQNRDGTGIVTPPR